MAQTPGDIARLLPARGGLLLLLDYDGTLVPFRDDPKSALPGTDLVRLLARLTDDPDREVVIVSGRSADDLRRLFPATPCHLLALHGAEYVDPGGGYLERVDLAPCRARVLEAAGACSIRLSSVPCVRIENKGAALALHTRTCDHDSEERARQLFREVALQATRGGALTIMEGSHVVELVPATANKGSGVLWLLERFGPSWFPVYIGDDTTDEDGFRALSDRGATIAVGPPGRTTAARHTLDDPAAVLRFLEGIASGT
jgi:trehalose-phosphatase